MAIIQVGSGDPPFIGEDRVGRNFVPILGECLGQIIHPDDMVRFREKVLNALILEEIGGVYVLSLTVDSCGDLLDFVTDLSANVTATLSRPVHDQMYDDCMHDLLQALPLCIQHNQPLLVMYLDE